MFGVCEKGSKNEYEIVSVILSCRHVHQTHLPMAIWFINSTLIILMLQMPLEIKLTTCIASTKSSNRNILKNTKRRRN